MIVGVGREPAKGQEVGEEGVLRDTGGRGGGGLQSEPSRGPMGDGGDNAKRTGQAAQDGSTSHSLPQGKLLGERPGPTG